MANFKSFGTPINFPLPIDSDWVRIHCGVNGEPNYIFGIEGLIKFYEAGTGIYTRRNGRPDESLEYWITWYENEKSERIKSYKLIQDIKNILQTKFS